MSASPLSRLGLPSDDTEGSPSSSRKAVLGLGALGAVGVVLAATVLLAGGDDLDDLGTPPAAAAAVPAAEASATPSPAPSVRFPDAEQVRNGRNPFEALYTAPSAVPDTAVPGMPDPAAPTVPGPAGGSAGPGASGGTGAQPPVEVPATARSLALLRVSGQDPSRTAVFTLDGAELPVAVGESFGPAADLLLLSLQQGPDTGGWTAVVQVGQGDPFDVVTGTPVSVP